MTKHFSHHIEAKTRFHELETRQAVIDFFVDRKSFGPKDLVTL